MHFEFHLDQTGQWRWTLIGADNSELANSAEGYRNAMACLRAVWHVRGPTGIPVSQRTVKGAIPLAEALAGLVPAAGTEGGASRPHL
jgi:uncharacterized protein YegP (UPF0339 family)